jgi:hypothetical protein
MEPPAHFRNTASVGLQSEGKSDLCISCRESAPLSDVVIHDEGSGCDMTSCRSAAKNGRRQSRTLWPRPQSSQSDSPKKMNPRVDASIDAAVCRIEWFERLQRWLLAQKKAWRVFAAGSGRATLCRCDAFQKQRSLDVVDEIRRSDFHWSCQSVVSKRSNKGPMAPADGAGHTFSYLLTYFNIGIAAGGFTHRDLPNRHANSQTARRAAALQNG